MSEVWPRLQVRVNVCLSNHMLSCMTLTKDSNRSNLKQPANKQSAPSTSSSESAPERNSPRGDQIASTDPALTGQVPLKLPRGLKSSMPSTNLLSLASTDESAQDNVADALPSTKKARLSASPGSISEEYSTDALVDEFRWGSIASRSIAHYSWKADPYELDSDLTSYLLAKYFTHIECATDCTIPRKPFTYWVVNSANKSSADIMLLYAMLAMGALFSRRGDLENHYKVFINVVQEAVLENGDRFSLQLIHTKLILALMAFSQGQYNRAYEHSGSASIAACGLKYNMEEGVCAITTPDELAFSFDRAVTIECRRRTFWTVYIMECFNMCCSTSVRAVYRSDCHLRLPSSSVAFDKGVISTAAYDLDTRVYGNESITVSGQAPNVGFLGYLVEIATIFNEVVTNIGRSKTRGVDDYPVSLNKFRRSIMTRLDVLRKSLLEDVHYPGSGTDNNEPVGGLYILYHYTTMLLHRHVRHGSLDSQTIVVHVREAYRNAQIVLENVQRLSAGGKKNMLMSKLIEASPTKGFAITAALDTITAAGTVCDLIDDEGKVLHYISIGLEALERLSDHWHSARQQRRLVKERLKVLLNAAKRACDFNGAYYFSEPMQSPFGSELDVVYGLPRLRYFQALGWVDKFHNDRDFHKLDGD